MHACLAAPDPPPAIKPSAPPMRIIPSRGGASAEAAAAHDTTIAPTCACRPRCYRERALSLSFFLSASLPFRSSFLFIPIHAAVVVYTVRTERVCWRGFRRGRLTLLTRAACCCGALAHGAERMRGTLTPPRGGHRSILGSIFRNSPLTIPPSRTRTISSYFRFLCVLFAEHPRV